MRPNKSTRAGEKRAPALSVLASAAAVVAVFLLAIWVFNGPDDRRVGFGSIVQTANSFTSTDRSSTLNPPKKDTESSSDVTVDKVKELAKPNGILPKPGPLQEDSKPVSTSDPKKKPKKEALDEEPTVKVVEQSTVKSKEDALNETDPLLDEEGSESKDKTVGLEDEVPKAKDKTAGREDEWAKAKEKSTILDELEEEELLSKGKAPVDDTEVLVGKERVTSDDVRKQRSGKSKSPEDEELDDIVEDPAARKIPVLDETSPGDKAELSVEKEESPSSLLSQRKKSKEERMQDVIEKSDTMEEKEILEELEKDSIVEPKKDLALDDELDTEDSIVGKPDKWELCTFDGAEDYIPCLDNRKAVKALKSTKHFEHRERHCPVGKDLPTCLVPLPEGYRFRIDWPVSRDKVWHANVPHDELATYKADQNWVKKKGDYLVFPGGGTQFKKGAMQYIESIQKTWRGITWGKHIRTVLDIGCGVASFGGYLFDKDVLTMSFAPKDEHKAQLQMALERGIPGLISVMGTKRLVFPSNAFDLLHCARCRVPWHVDDGKLLQELNRVLRPGGYFVWSATPVYRLKDENEVEIWDATKKIMDAMCWKLLVRTKADPVTLVGMAIFQKPVDNACYDTRIVDEPAMCAADDKPDAAWYVDMNSCIHRVPTAIGTRGAKWPAAWPDRLEESPAWLKTIPKGVFGKPAIKEFKTDTSHWQHVFAKSYATAVGIDWNSVRNVLDMNAGYGGFAASLISQPLWVMNVIPTNEPDTLPIIYERGLFGVYHDWCESFSTYPRSYDLLHADRVFTSVQKRCGIKTTLIEMDRMLRPGGWAIFRDKAPLTVEIEEIVKSLHWIVKYTYESGSQRLLAARKGKWRPEDAL